MDELKKYLSGHRDQIDTEPPPDLKVWQGVQRGLHREEKRPAIARFRWVAAAAIVVLLSAGAFWWLRTAPSGEGLAKHSPSVIESEKVPAKPLPDTQKTEVQKPAIEVLRAPVTSVTKERTVTRSKSKGAPAEKEALSPLQALANNFDGMIGRQVRRLENMPIYAEDADYFKELRKQWQDLQQEEKAIQQDAADYGVNDRLVEQLIQVYQKKLSFLKQWQNEISKMNARTRRHQSSGKTQPSFLKM